jgi:Na+/melibiose symporter-like transporter
MEMLDILALTGLDRLYDRVEDRYGRTAAWLLTSATALALIGIIVWVLFAVLWR